MENVEINQFKSAPLNSENQVIGIIAGSSVNIYEVVTFICILTNEGTKKIRVEDVIDEIEKGKKYYIQKGFKKIYLQAAINLNKKKFLKTESDGGYPDILLTLPDCGNL